MDPVMKPHFTAPPRRQDGYILLLVLVALVAMMVSGIALVRSMDTSQLVAGNLANRNGTLHSADLGVQQAVTWIQAQATTGALNTTAAANGYYASGADQAWNTPSFWTACATCTVTDGANNTVSWAISRMCNNDGDPNGAGIFCSALSGTTSSGGSSSSDAINFAGSPVHFYRITVQVRDTRNTTTLSQAFVTL
jgi:Tfp pilus assembly protein PilX